MIFKAFKYKGVPIKILSPTLATDEYEEILNDKQQGDVITVFMDFDIIVPFKLIYNTFKALKFTAFENLHFSVILETGKKRCSNSLIV